MTNETWILTGNTGGIWTNAQPAEQVAIVRDVTSKKGAARGRIIAAAPELFEALQNMLRLYDALEMKPGSDPVVHLARAAISKAKGQL